MWNIFKKLTPKPLTPIRAGDYWVLNNNIEDPWGKKSEIKVKIIDAKDNWVRYDMGGIVRDNLMKEKTFRYCYSYVHPNPQSI